MCSDDELAEEAMDPDEAADLELRALAAEEMVDINGLLAAVKRLPPDSKAGVLLEELRGPAGAGLPPGDGVHPVHRHHGLSAHAHRRASSVPA